MASDEAKQIDAGFNLARTAVEARGQDGMSNDTLLKLYGLFKQATCGDAPEGRPGVLQMRARAKWDAWDARRGMDANTAKAMYVVAVSEAGLLAELNV